MDADAVIEQWQEKYNLGVDWLELLARDVDDAFDLIDPTKRDAVLAHLEKEIAESEFIIEKLIGSGAFGSVYRGKRKRDNLQIAIKIIDLEESKEDISTINREIKALVDGKSCSQLTNYYGSTLHGTKLWIIMEYVDGGSILDRLKEKLLDEKEIAVVVREVLEGLKYLGNEGKIHRDIKAANILLSRNGEVKLADFGASGQLTDSMSKCNTFVGSPYWMAPEVLTQNKYDGKKADVWSLGITCIEMGEGKPPHAKLSPVQVIGLIPHQPPPQLAPNKYSADFQNFVARCLEHNPQQRPSIKDLFNHPFVKNAGKTDILRRQ